MKNTDHIYAPKKRYYASKQLYRFVRPGSQRIAATADAPGLLVSAFWNGATSSFIIVGAKQGPPGRIQISLPHASAMPAAWELYETTSAVDCTKVDTVPVRDGIAEFELPDEAIFTLVAKPGKD